MSASLRDVDPEYQTVSPGRRGFERDQSRTKVGRKSERSVARKQLRLQGRTLNWRRAGVLAYSDHHAPNGPTEAINGRLEALRRNALGFRNLTHYRWRPLLRSGALHQLVNAL